MDLGLEINEGYEEFQNLCSDLNQLDDNPSTVIDPKKRLQIMNEIRHLLKPNVYREIMKEYEQRKKQLIADVLNMGDRREFTPLHVAAYFGNYALVRHYL